MPRSRLDAWIPGWERWFEKQFRGLTFPKNRPDDSRLRLHQLGVSLWESAFDSEWQVKKRLSWDVFARCGDDLPFLRLSVRVHACDWNNDYSDSWFDRCASAYHKSSDFDQIRPICATFIPTGPSYVGLFPPVLLLADHLWNLMGRVPRAPCVVQSICVAQRGVPLHSACHALPLVLPLPENEPHHTESD